MRAHRDSGPTSVSYGRKEPGCRRVKSLLTEPHTWLGAGAITLGVAGAMASGAGVATADPGAESGSSAGSPRSATKDQASRGGGLDRVGPGSAKPDRTDRTPPRAHSVRTNNVAKTAFSARRGTVTMINQEAPVAAATSATISVAAAANAAPADTLTAAKLLTGIPDTPDTIKIDLLEYPHAVPRVVVYMSGISGDGPLTQSFLNAIVANVSGTQYSQVGNYIDKFIEDRNLGADTVIMLVGLSNGGQQMQFYATGGKYRSQVTTVVTFASPLVKKVSEYPEQVTPWVDSSWSGIPYVINIQAKNDPVPSRGNKPGTVPSYQDGNKSAIDFAKAQVALAKFSIFGWRPFGGLLAKAKADLARAEKKAADDRATKILYVVPGDGKLSGLSAHGKAVYKPYAEAFDASAIGQQSSAAIKQFKGSPTESVTYTLVH